MLAEQFPSNNHYLGNRKYRMTFYRGIRKIAPKKGQESVWDYPRPPGLERFHGQIRIVFNKMTIVDTHDIYRVIETSHPPTYYVPLNHFMKDVLQHNSASSFCEYKGRAQYYNIIINGKKAVKAAWQYPDAKGTFEEIREYVAVYSHLMDACFLNGEQVTSQEGSFYGGWITSNIVGPFKGGPGTWGW